ncbi:MAG: DUF2461 domain-containing protein [Adhaeribacter sp.]
MKNNIDKATLDFISDLQQNNTREWFAENKNRYEASRTDFFQFLEGMLAGAAAFEPLALGQQAKDLVFRIYRDVRFSKNKNPYKDHYGAYLAEGGRKSVLPGYYLHLSPHNNSFIACGLWMPPAEFLKAVRQEIDYNLTEFQELLAAPTFKKYFKEVEGETLKTNPKGYEKDNPALTYLRHKSWMVSHPLPDALLTSNNALEVVLQAMQQAKPFKEFLMRPLLEISTPENS